MDTEYSTASLITRERVSRLVHLHWYTCPQHLLLSFVVVWWNSTVSVFKGTANIVYWWVVFDRL